MDHADRARELVRTVRRAGHHEGTVECVAAALREVELDAIERAARVADEVSGFPDSFMAAKIRALTSGGPSGGSSLG